MKTVRCRPDWGTLLAADETAKFMAVCERQGRDPADVVRQLVAMYIDSGGDVPQPAQDMDGTLFAFLDWCVDGAIAIKPSRPRGARPRSVS
ncbi:MAG: hypothetical protein EOP58_05745 [Sphingomonadales bacterium]|nr:MAG: hypothetical protein EOP58_05745 [Sphingomonadales bacterium]